MRINICLCCGCGRLQLRFEAADYLMAPFRFADCTSAGLEVNSVADVRGALWEVVGKRGVNEFLSHFHRQKGQVR